MVDGSGAELSAELLGSQSAQICDEERPEVKDVVARETLSLLHHLDPRASQQGRLHRTAQATRARPYHQDLDMKR